MITGTLARFRRWARNIKRDVHAVWLAARDPRVPLQVKLLALVIAAYAVSPVDLIPDFIPVLGYLDDLIIVPLGIWLVVRLVPPDIMDEHRGGASRAASRPVSRAAAAVFIGIWIVALVVLVRLWLKS